MNYSWIDCLIYIYIYIYRERERERERERADRQNRQTAKQIGSPVSS